MKCGNQAFSAGSVPDFREYNYVTANDPLASSSCSGVVLKFPDSLAGKTSDDVASPVYQALQSGVDAPIYQPVNSGADAPNYQPLNSNRKSPEKTSEGNAATVCNHPTMELLHPSTKH